MRAGSAQAQAALFMAYMASIEDLFEFMQAEMANGGRASAKVRTEFDPVIGQGNNPTSQVWPTVYGQLQANFRFSDFVHLLGGGYYYVPSLPFFAGLGLPAGIPKSAGAPPGRRK